MSSATHVDGDEASHVPHHRRRRRSFSTFLYGDDTLESQSTALPSVASLPATIVTTSAASIDDNDNEEDDALVGAQHERNSWFAHRLNVIVNHSNNDSSIEDDEGEEYSEMALWDGIFWLEACRSMSRSVGWFQLLSVVEGVREEAYRAGMWFAPPPHWTSSGVVSSSSSSSSSSGSTTSWPQSPSPPPPTSLSPTFSVATTLMDQ